MNRPVRDELNLEYAIGGLTRRMARNEKLLEQILEVLKKIESKTSDNDKKDEQPCLTQNQETLSQ